MVRANLYSLIFAIPAGVLLTGIYLFIWGKEGLIVARFVIRENFLLTILIIVIGILVHELIHGLSWVWFGKKPLSSISYGINLKALSPYDHCNESLDIRAYRLGAMMPGLILGLIPALLGIASGNGLIMIFGLLFTVAAGGDALVIWLLRKEKSTVKVMDHAVNAGCYVIDAE